MWIIRFGEIIGRDEVIGRFRAFSISLYSMDSSLKRLLSLSATPKGTLRAPAVLPAAAEIAFSIKIKSCSGSNYF
jgi:hypothetical protein